MPVTSEITLDMCLVELQRIGQHMRKHYPAMVQQNKITPYQRDHRLAVNAKMVQLLTDAKKNKHTHNPTFIDLIKQLP